MTGYGSARFEDEKYFISAEVRTLNSKFLDLSVRMPKSFNDKEIEVRNIISNKLERGKVNLMLEFALKDGGTPVLHVNEKLFIAYYDKLKSLSDEVDAQSSDIFKMAIQFPDVIESIDDDKEKDKEWSLIKPVIIQAIESCNEFREKEGRVLSGNLKSYIEKIDDYLESIKKLDPKRIERIRQRLEGNIKEFVKREELDENRLEQELIYYIEKLDISEEKVRLASHLKYFLEILHSASSMGKKMNFIAQEIGREINTIGSKSNDAEMQKLVVNMKEELEKIKEQVLNIL